MAGRWIVDGRDALIVCLAVQPARPAIPSAAVDDVGAGDSVHLGFGRRRRPNETFLLPRTLLVGPKETKRKGVGTSGKE